ncbi:unnamed protein product [Adineta steineri]|uniref:Uncharacterized protein n=1 Tax=Adineta steineri TaxID=433720 RepID=A0A813SUR4_9BILA|nr:unnamed protein product [Adineta steineri]
MNCQQQHQQVIFNSRQMIKTKHQYFWSTKFYNNTNKDTCIQHYQFQNNSVRSTDTQDLSLPVYRAPCTFQNSLVTNNKGKNDSLNKHHFTKQVYKILSEYLDGYSCGVFRRSPLSSTSSSCVPDVYSPGSRSSGNCSPPPPSSNLPPPPSEWLH